MAKGGGFAYLLRSIYARSASLKKKKQTTLHKFKHSIYYNYPFTNQFLKENFEYIDWRLILWNRNIDWNVELLEMIKDEDGVKWKFRRNEILTNSKIASNQDIIFQYFDRINLSRISENRYINWDEKLLEKLNGKIDIGIISNNLNVPLNFIEQNKEKINWEKLSWNSKIDWTSEFIDKNKELLNWSNLSCNLNISWNEEIIERFENYWNWSSLSNNSKILWTESLLNKYQERIDWQKLSYNPSVEVSIGYLENNLDKFHIYGVSRNKKIEWNDELISKYEDDFNFGNYGLSWNDALPWSKELINKYRTKWSWSGISSNYGIPWTEKMLDCFSDELIWGRNDKIKEGSADAGHRRNGFCLSNNPNLPWSLKFIDKYKDRFREHSSNTGIWKKVLKPILTDEKVKEIIKEEKKRTPNNV